MIAVALVVNGLLLIKEMNVKNVKFKDVPKVHMQGVVMEKSGIGKEGMESVVDGPTVAFSYHVTNTCAMSISDMLNIKILTIDLMSKVSRHPTLFLFVLNVNQYMIKPSVL